MIFPGISDLDISRKITKIIFRVYFGGFPGFDPKIKKILEFTLYGSKSKTGPKTFGFKNFKNFLGPIVYSVFYTIPHYLQKFYLTAK